MYRGVTIPKGCSQIDDPSKVKPQDATAEALKDLSAECLASTTDGISCSDHSKLVQAAATMKVTYALLRTGGAAIQNKCGDATAANAVADFEAFVQQTAGSKACPDDHKGWMVAALSLAGVVALVLLWFFWGRSRSSAQYY